VSWAPAIGQESAQSRPKPRLGVPHDLAITDILVFGEPLKELYMRGKKTPD